MTKVVSEALQSHKKVEKTLNFFMTLETLDTMNFFLKYFIAWLPMLILAILNGTLRDLGYKKYVSDLVAHQLSTFSLLLLLGLYVGYIIQKLPPQSPQQALGIGIFWMSLTLR